MCACMYEIRDRQDPVKGSGWVLFPSTMAKQPIQQMVVGHLYVCMYVCMYADWLVAVHYKHCYQSLTKQ